MYALSSLVFSVSGLICFECHIQNGDDPNDSDYKKCLNPNKKNKETLRMCTPSQKYCAKGSSTNSDYMTRYCVSGTPPKPCIEDRKENLTKCYCRFNLCNDEPGLKATKGDIGGSGSLTPHQFLSHCLHSYLLVKIPNFKFST